MARVGGYPSGDLSWSIALRLFNRLIHPMLLAAVLGLPLGSGWGLGAARADLAGPYLAARTATLDGDYREAANYYGQALLGDPGNAFLQESELIALIGMDDMTTAKTFAATMDISRGKGSPIAALVQIAAMSEAGDFDALQKRVAEGINGGTLLDGLVQGWSYFGMGQMSEASAAFDALAKQDPTMAVFGAYHKALALAAVGDFETADKIFAGDAGVELRPTRRGVIAHAQILSQLERDTDAMALIDKVFGPELDPALAGLRAELAAGKTVPFTAVTSPADGMSEVFFTLASALSNELPEAITLVYARLAVDLRPNHIDAILLAASLLDQQHQFELSTAVYAKVPQDDPSFTAAELGRANALGKAGKVDAKIEVLTALTRAKPELATIWIELGDAQRQLENYKEALPAYNKAVALLGEPSAEQWFVYFARGIAEERLKQWKKAEADFRLALKLNPDQPQVLNYLGYSFVERGENLDEALDMIQRAATAQPEAGYILDSLGWAEFRLGRYADAVGNMEKAIEQMPVDSLVNDHLGDVYWAVGRKREAEFQWRRALSFEPETEADAVRIRAKLEKGLDQVLVDEKQPPLKSTDAH
jgi:tetratricopeptide (TPR) repeat protein